MSKQPLILTVKCSLDKKTVNQREPSPTACGARRKEGEDVPQHSELSHECDENEVMLQAGPLVRAQLEEPEKKTPSGVFFSGILLSLNWCFG